MSYYDGTNTTHFIEGLCGNSAVILRRGTFSSFCGSFFARRAKKEPQSDLGSWRLFAFGRAVLPFFWFVIFALVERKNDKHMLEEYRSDHRRQKGV